MAKILSITDGARFRMSPKARKYRTARPVRPNPWSRIARAVSSPVAIVGYFILLLMGCARLH
jgi:hypothetical protein